MRHALIPLALGLGVSASSLQKRWHECKFELNAQGGANGCIGQIGDGQCRIGSKYPPATFTLDKHSGILKDSKGRGCIITGSSHQQIQCDDGKTGTPGWTLENGELKHNGCGDFAACPVNDFGEWNIYKYTIKDQLKCVGIHLKGSCGPASAPPAPPRPDWHPPKPEWHPPKPEWHPPKPEGQPSKPDWQPNVPHWPSDKGHVHPPAKPCCHDCSEEKEHDCHKSCDKKCKPLPSPAAPKPCCHECPEEKEHKCHESCDKGCKAPPPPPEQHIGPPRKVAYCLKWCDKGDWRCKKRCHGFEIPPPAKDAPPLHPKKCKPCKKCKGEDEGCLKNCSKECGKPKPKPCKECKPFSFTCKQDCISEAPKPKPSPKCCYDCEKKDKPCHKSCDKGCFQKRAVEATTACASCPRDDDNCKSKCHGPKPPPCHSCKKKPDCEKKCWEHVPSPAPKPKPAPWCDQCAPYDHQCFKFCTPPKHKPQPKHHVCCAECKNWDRECFKACHPPKKPEWKHEWKPESKPEEPLPCNKCPPKAEDCKKNCSPPDWKPEWKPEWKPKPKPQPCHKCHRKEEECKKTCKPVPCHKCPPKEDECRKSCKPHKPLLPLPWLKPWLPSGPKPYPMPVSQTFPKCCDQCRKAEPKCKESCVSREVLDRLIADAAPQNAIESNEGEELVAELEDQVKQADNLNAEVDTKQAEASQGDASEEEAHQLNRRAEANKQCRCADGDNDCIGKCVIVEVEEEIVVCKDCSKKKGCSEAKRCEPIKPKPCDVCHEEPKEEACKKTCYLKPKKSVPCGKCKPWDRECKKSCYKPAPPKCCGDCDEKDKPCFKECDKKCKPQKQPKKPVPCWDCKKGEWDCLEHCFVPEEEKPKPKPAPPKCCHDCHEEDKPCFKKCDNKCKPLSAPKPVPCWECIKGDSECLEHCFVPEEQEPKPPAKCCNDCHEEDKPCFKKCDKCKPKPPPQHPKGPVLCDECPYKDFKCLETCFLKPKHKQDHKPEGQHHGPPPPPHLEQCVESCGKGDWECKKACHFPPKPHGSPPPPPAPPKPKCCDDCDKHNSECKKSCWEKPKPHHLPPPPPPPPKPESAPPKECGCKEGDWACWKGCYPPPPPPGGNWQPAPPAQAPQAPQHPHAPPPTWGAPVSPPKANIPGQPYGACPANLAGDYQFPHLIVPISTAEPQKSHGSVYSPLISDSVSTIFNFDIPQAYTGKTCSLFFFFPEQKELKTSSYKFSGKGLASFDVVGQTEQGTTCANRPVKHAHLNDVPVRPGTTYWIADHKCTPGTVGFEMSGSGGFALEYFQDYNPAPIGLYVRAC